MTFDTQRLGQLMGDIEAQPNWRTPANKCCAYYDGEQLPENVAKALDEKGLPKLVYNLVKPTVNGVLGMEARTRTDLIVQADNPGDDMDDMLNAINERYKDVRRICDADMAESDAYASMIKSGVGWVEVYRNPFPMSSPYKVKFVHRDEVFWDFNSKDRDLGDCRWILRRRWDDVDSAKAMFPQCAEAISCAINNDFESRIGTASTEMIEGEEPPLVAAWAEYQKFTRKESEWLQSNRKRVLIQCVYYSTFKKVTYLESQSGVIVEYDPNDKIHNAIVATGKAEVKIGMARVIREAWFVGPIKVADKACEAPQGMFPLVPYWGYRRDSNGMPYGLIADMITPQDSVNFRYIKLTAQLNNKTIIMDNDATNMTRKQVKEEVNKVDGLIELNPERRNRNTIAESFQVSQDNGIAAQQFQLAKDSQEMIQQCAGVYNAMLGQGSAGQSGIAINSLIEQGSTTLSEINDNYRHSRLMLGRLIMLYLFEDMSRQRNVNVTIFKDDPTRKKQVILNATIEGDRKLNNDVARIRASVALAPIQQTPTFRAQLAQQLTQIAGTLPPEVQMATIDMILELMDIPNKQDFLARVRKALGIKKDPDRMTPEEQAQAQAEAEAQQQQQQAMMRAEMARIAKEEAEAALKAAQAQNEERKLQTADIQDGKTQAETAKIVSEVQQADAANIAANMPVIAQMRESLSQIAI
ncbi:MAG: hypothetical protein ACRCVX_02240 [Shewanella sp.]